ncbi:MAG: alpha/beta hydrolase family protein [Rhodocyclales bacterium]|nr:alpha/beta hydrolase family protein [Rhodocyclales bacterium]
MTLAATLHLPQGSHEVGVVMVVGGHQTRAGSHRQFLRLARRLAAEGHVSLRFDLPGLGDSAGTLLPFDDNGLALRAAIDALIQAVPSIRRVVLWGLCDGATAAALYAVTDARIAGLVLANPWVRTGQVHAQVLVKSYYRQRLLSPTFWGKLLRGQVGVVRSATEWLSTWRTARSAGNTTDGDLPARLRRALSDFSGSTSIIIAEQDLTGQEFLLVAKHIEPTVSIAIHSVEGADHTFSTQAWHQQLEDLSISAIAEIKTPTSASPA